MKIKAPWCVTIGKSFDLGNGRDFDVVNTNKSFLFLFFFCILLRVINLGSELHRFNLFCFFNLN